MIFDLTKGFVPEAYSSSRDYKVFLRLLGIVCTVLKYNTDHLSDLYDADKCPSQLLPLLATMVGYEYDSSLSEKFNRAIIKAYPTLIKNKGSIRGLEMATALSLNTNMSENAPRSLDQVWVSMDDKDTGEIMIYYPSSITELNKQLIEVVRPAGTVINYVPADNREVLGDTLKLLDETRHETHTYLADDTTVIPADIWSEVEIAPVTKPEQESE